MTSNSFTLVTSRNSLSHPCYSCSDILGQVWPWKTRTGWPWWSRGPQRWYCLQTMNHKENTPTAETKQEWLTWHSLCLGWLSRGAGVEGAKEDTISPPRGPGQVTVLSLLLIYRMRGLDEVSTILFPALKLQASSSSRSTCPTKGSLGQDQWEALLSFLLSIFILWLLSTISPKQS